jgi:hypothetical protein
MNVIRNSVVEPSIELHTPTELGQIDLNFALARIKNTPAGTALLNEIRENSIKTKQIRIIANPLESNQVYPELSHKQMEQMPREVMVYPEMRDYKARNFALKKGFFKGEGASARIIYNRSRVDSSVFGIRDEEFIAEFNENGVGLPNNDPTLFNNLVHAMRILKGTYTDDNTLEGREDEEVRAIGNGDYKGFPISENEFRQQIGFPLRAYYPDVTNDQSRPLMQRPGLMPPQ